MQPSEAINPPYQLSAETGVAGKNGTVPGLEPGSSTLYHDGAYSPWTATLSE